MVRTLSMIATERVKSGEWLPPWTLAEHEARYAFASRFVRGLAVVDCASGNGNGAAVFLRSEPASLVGFDGDLSDSGLAMYRTADGGASWQRRSVTLAEYPVCYLQFHDIDFVGSQLGWAIGGPT